MYCCWKLFLFLLGEIYLIRGVLKITALCWRDFCQIEIFSSNSSND